MTATAGPASPARRVLIASMVGTTVEFYDFYIYAMAAVPVFPQLFFPKANPASATLQSLATFALAFLARPIGSALLTMGLSTLAIMAFGFAFEPLFGTHDRIKVCAFLALGFALTGLASGPLSSTLASLFPVHVRYTGSSLTFNFAGIIGASLAPYLATRHGVGAVGRYLSASCVLTAAALSMLGRRSADRSAQPAGQLP